MDYQIINLFELVRTSARSLRTRNKEFDGLSFWKTIKSNLAESDFEAEWKKLPDKYSEEILSLNEYNEDGTMNENNHFLIQMIRIPKKEKCSLKKIIQIAFNIGQYQGINFTALEQINKMDHIKFDSISNFIDEKYYNINLVPDIISEKNLNEIIKKIFEYCKNK